MNDEIPAELFEILPIEEALRVLKFDEISQFGDPQRHWGLIEVIGCPWPPIPCLIVNINIKSEDRIYCQQECGIAYNMKPIEILSIIYKACGSLFRREEPPRELNWGKLDLERRREEYRQEEEKRPRLWAEREFFRFCLNYIALYNDWSEEDFDVEFTYSDGQLKIKARNMEVFCPARGTFYGALTFSALPAHSTFNVRLMLTLLGDIATVGHQAPLNIAMVIDNSGSMHGEKITKVKEAASMIVGMLAPHDIFSLVTFNDKVNTIVPTAKGADLAGVDKLINMIKAGGNTDLSAGYNEGCNLAFDAANIAASRVVLLSDGIANRGHMHGADIARKFRYLRISTTTFGVGDDFDEVLLTSIAEEGGGSANFIQHPWQAAEVFREELEDLRSITATNTRIRFTSGQSIVSHTLLNNFPDDGNGSWLIGDVYGAKERRIVIELEIKTGEEIDDLIIGSFEILYDIPGKGMLC